LGAADSWRVGIRGYLGSDAHPVVGYEWVAIPYRAHPYNYFWCALGVLVYLSHEPMRCAIIVFLIALFFYVGDLWIPTYYLSY